MIAVLNVWFHFPSWAPFFYTAMVSLQGWTIRNDFNVSIQPLSCCKRQADGSPTHVTVTTRTCEDRIGRWGSLQPPSGAGCTVVQTQRDWLPRNRQWYRLFSPKAIKWIWFLQLVVAWLQLQLTFECTISLRRAITFGIKTCAFSPSHSTPFLGISFCFPSSGAGSGQRSTVVNWCSKKSCRNHVCGIFTRTKQLAAYSAINFKRRFIRVTVIACVSTPIMAVPLFPLCRILPLYAYYL